MAASRQLGDLDDACILHIFSFLTPLPDLFNIAGCCRRLRDLALDRRSWLVVTRTRQPSLVGIPRQHREQFDTLREAIRASRPGDTIVLLPGEEHDVSDVVVPFPLHIMGGGSTPEQTLLTCARGADTALDFRASAGRLFNLTIRSPRGACVTHRCGKLSIERCCLRSDHPPFLDHLVSAIVTLAAGPQQAQRAGQPAEASLPLPQAQRAQRTPPPVAAAAVRKEAQEAGGRAAAPLPLAAPTCRGVGPGVLSVVESEIQGGGVAVRLEGTGELRGVRVIYRSQRENLFWFHVDSAVPGVPQHAAAAAASAVRRVRQQQQLGATKRPPAVATAEAGAAKRPRASAAAGATPAPVAPAPPAPPAWMQRPHFDPLAFQQRVASEMQQMLMPTPAAGTAGAGVPAPGRQAAPPGGAPQQLAAGGLGVQLAAEVAAAGEPGSAAPGRALPLEKKAEEWSRHHAATLGDSRTH